MYVSIHAPTRGATHLLLKVPFSPAVVSIHAPTRGATAQSIFSCGLRACFNPRTHTGCDRTAPLNTAAFASFNPRTHTGCDHHHLQTSFQAVCFNPRTHTGCDLLKIDVIKMLCLFQSTHPHGVRPRGLQNQNYHYLVSIHAPTRGATKSIVSNSLSSTFQSTHPHGVRLKGFVNTIARERVSIHAPTRGATTLGEDYLRIRQSFNPRTHTGCDDFECTFLTSRQFVSIHAPTRGATCNRIYFISCISVSIHAPTRGATIFFVY